MIEVACYTLLKYHHGKKELSPGPHVHKRQRKSVGLRGVVWSHPRDGVPGLVTEPSSQRRKDMYVNEHISLIEHMYDDFQN